LKQGEYLKIRVEKAEKTVESAEKVINEQKLLISNQKQMIITKDDLYKDLVFKSEQEQQMKDEQINVLNSTIQINNQFYKKENRKKFWSGAKIGTLSGAAIMALTILLLK
jgi:hypothetical protein